MRKSIDLIETTYHSIQNGIDHNVLHLTGDSEKIDGRHVQIGGKRLINFLSYSYLGLDQHPRLIEASINAVRKYGVNWGSSRAYFQIDLYKELEELLSQIFGGFALVGRCTTLAHMAALPALIKNDDVILIDQHVHASVQDAVKKFDGVPREIIKHNSIEQLEDRIQSLRNHHRKIWFCCDGVYSMYGDLAPLKELEQLTKKYPEFNLYIDDAHGMSWTGSHGKGYALSQVELSDQIVVVSSLNKAFATDGGVIITSNRVYHERIKVSGPTMIFCSPISPMLLGAAVACARIHLTNELAELQSRLMEKVRYFKSISLKKGLPVVSSDLSPIQFIGCGNPEIAYEMAARLKEHGFLCGLGLYPAVAMSRSGLRISISNHQTIDHIDMLVDVLGRELPSVAALHNMSIDKIFKRFKLKPTSLNNIEKKDFVSVIRFDSINEIDPSLWNKLFGDKGNFDWEGIRFMESVFRDNDSAENNWIFSYFICYVSGQPIAATFLTESLVKDDIFYSARKSIVIENQRVRGSNPHFLTSKTLMLGSPFSEGDHLYCDFSSPYWKSAIKVLLKSIDKLKVERQIPNIVLRDFPVLNKLDDIFSKSGFVRINTGVASSIDHLPSNSGELLNLMGPKSRRNHRNEILKYESQFIPVVNRKVTELDIKHWYNLYLNVKNKAFEINTFNLPNKVFRAFVDHNNWDVLELFSLNSKEPVSVVFSYMSANNYSPMFIGLDYDSCPNANVYKQSLYQVVKRAIDLNKRTVHFGFTAERTKKIVGCQPIEKVAYVQLEDDFNVQVIENIRSSSFAVSYG